MRGDAGSSSVDLQGARDLLEDRFRDAAAHDDAVAGSDAPPVRPDAARSDSAGSPQDRADGKDGPAHLDQSRIPDDGGQAGCRGNVSFGGFVAMSQSGGKANYYGTPTFLAVADVNGDKKPDMIVANSETANAGVLLGRADGTFFDVAVFATGAPYSSDVDGTTGPFSVAVGDLNGDGKPDIVAANTSPGTVGVLLGNGDGTFAAHVDYGCGKKPFAVALGDLDGDRNLDIVTANHDSNTVSVLFGRGDGTFASKRDTPTGDGPKTVVVGDLNNDGRLDVVTVNELANTVSVLLGGGDGSFTAEQDIALGAALSSTLGAAALGDLDGDGKLDIVVAAGEVSVLLGTGRGTFGKVASYPTAGGNAAAVALGDLNGDGKLDVLATGYDSMAVFLGQGDGTLAARRDFESASRPSMAVIADMNADGRMDVAMPFGTSYSRTAGVLLGNGDGTFDGRHVGSAADNDPVALAVGDVNRDGRTDFVVGYRPDGISVMLGTTDKTLVPKTSFRIGAKDLTDELESLALADFNGDGRPDIVAATYDWSMPMPSTVSVLSGAGDGSFATALTTPLSFHATSLKVADFDGDRKQDVVVLNTEAGTATVLLGKGDGTFGTATDYAVGSLASQIALGDVNRDGTLDMVVSRYGGGAGVLLGKADGTFAVATDLDSSAVGSWSSLALADLNGDGNLDLVGATTVILDGMVAVSFGNGDGTFATEIQLETGGNNAMLGPIGDFNHDGNLDIIATSANYLPWHGVVTMSLLLGHGDGTFAPHVDYPIDDPILASADVNGDGTPDLLAASHDSAADVLFSACR